MHGNLTKALLVLGAHQPPLPSWAEYLACDPDARKEIETRWCAVGHGYQGTRSQRSEAMTLYSRAIALRPKQLSIVSNEHIREADYDGDGGREWRDSQERA